VEGAGAAAASPGGDGSGAGGGDGAGFMGGGADGASPQLARAKAGRGARPKARPSLGGTGVLAASASAPSLYATLDPGAVPGGGL
jgi:hypothetical protein